MHSKRNEQIRELLEREVSFILVKYLALEDFSLVSVSNLELSKDASQAKVWVSVLSNKENLQDELDKNVYFIQKELNKLLSMKVVPKLILKADI